MKNKNAKDGFMDAFWTLYQKKRIEKISIRELCETAGYNRTTFYVYFKDIYDLLEQFIGVKVIPDLSSLEAAGVLSNLYGKEKTDTLSGLISRNEAGRLSSLASKEKGGTLVDLSSGEKADLLLDFGIIQKTMCYFFERKNQYIEVILRNHHNYVLQEMILSKIKGIVARDISTEAEYAIRYQISAILGVLEFWYQQGNNRISEEKLLTLIYEIAMKGVLPVLTENK